MTRPRRMKQRLDRPEVNRRRRHRLNDLREQAELEDLMREADRKDKGNTR